LLALQGPGSSLLLSIHLSDQLLEQKKNSKIVTRIQGVLVDIARTGYTGEDGFEIFCRPDDVRKLWRLFLEQGAEPCGLGARDTLRLEAGFPLFGHEFTPQTNPLCSDYAWVVKDKPFYGREAMWGKPCEKHLVGLRLLERGIPRQGYALYKNSENIGEVTSGTISPLTRESIALGWVKKNYAVLGEEIAVEIRGQKVAATIVKPPFYQS
jgi:aminomethyltransferase